MKDLLKQTLMTIFTKATTLARKRKQTVGETKDYYITLGQLNAILMELEPI